MYRVFLTMLSKVPSMAYTDNEIVETATAKLEYTGMDRLYFYLFQTCVRTEHILVFFTLSCIVKTVKSHDLRDAAIRSYVNSLIKELN